MGQAFENTGAAWLGAEESTLRGDMLLHIVDGIAGASDATGDRVIEHRQVIVAIAHSAGAFRADAEDHAHGSEAAAFLVVLVAET